MGSCFAQHISKHIARKGITHLVAETCTEELSEGLKKSNFGVYSARYGNVYTVRQARQLFDRAFGIFQPADAVWELGDRYVDAFRPQIDPAGFQSPGDVEADRLVHLAATRRVFTEANVLVFTLGLTEAWESSFDGAIYPTAPGVHGGTCNSHNYRFVNFTANEVAADLAYLIDSVRALNPTIRVILTVSPVPLIATFESRHVISSNTLSKAALRVAADEVASSREYVEYFPSFEIITGSAWGAQYFAPDLRTITPAGVAHVMRIFDQHFLKYEDAQCVDNCEFDDKYVSTPIVCDEEVIEATMRRAGYQQLAEHPERYRPLRRVASKLRAKRAT